MTVDPNLRSFFFTFSKGLFWQNKQFNLELFFKMPKLRESKKIGFL